MNLSTASWVKRLSRDAKMHEETAKGGGNEPGGEDKTKARCAASSRQGWPKRVPRGGQEVTKIERGGDKMRQEMPNGAKGAPRESFWSVSYWNSNVILRDPLYSSRTAHRYMKHAFFQGPESWCMCDSWGPEFLIFVGFYNVSGFSVVEVTQRRAHMNRS